MLGIELTLSYTRQVLYCWHPGLGSFMPAAGNSWHVEEEHSHEVFLD